MPRLFVALDLPDAVRDQVAALRAPDALDARWSDPEQYHVTLRFIGDTDADTAERYEEALAQVDAPAAECAPYGLDVLPSRRTPNVLIVGFDRSESLLSVYESVSDALQSVGLDPEERTYHPHVTLARLDDVSAKTVHSFLDDHEADVPSFTADRIHLIESTLTPDGAVYEHRRAVSIGA
jgi:2'-5' RNA ligase